MIFFRLGLTFLRLLLGPVALCIAVWQYPRLAFAPVLALGILSDYFDGVLARKLNVARPWLRRFDSITDIIYYLFVFASTVLVSGQTIRRALVWVALLLASEAACIIVSLVRFGKYPATHCYTAKFYGLMLFVVFLGILCWNWGPVVVVVLAIAGLVANAEVIVILLVSKRPPVDVLSVWHLKKSIWQTMIFIGKYPLLEVFQLCNLRGPCRAP